MRRRLALVGLATTALVVITFLVPLALLVSRQAEDRARVEAERAAQTTASLVAVVVTFEPTTAAIESAVAPLEPGVIVVLPGGETLGDPHEGQGSLVEPAIRDQATITSIVEGGWEIALPIVGLDGVTVVDAMATDEELSAGVVEAWVLLGLLGLVVVAASVWIGDRLGRQFVDPIEDLEQAAHRLGEGDLETRVDVNDPPELRRVGDAFNTLAVRLEELLAAERESAADLSHRLRTPLTSLRLQAESLSDEAERARVLSQVERLEQSIDRLIAASRVGKGSVGRTDLGLLVTDRAAFWSVLAEEERRPMEVDVGEGTVELGLPHEEVEAVFDALVGNVFSHTPIGTPLWISTRSESGRLVLEVADGGPGFGDDFSIARGVSGAGSTGLGLDIARRTAELTGGSLQVGDRPGGGAVVRVLFG